MAKSENIGKLAEALCKVQAEITGAKKTSINPHFKSRYADLTEVWNACREPLAENGLCVIQTNEPSDRGVCLRTTLIHTSGEWIDGIIDLPAVKQDAQGYGSAQTYARRYALASMVGITAEDDDGQAASRPRATITPVAGAMDRITVDQQTMVNDLAVQVLALAVTDINSAYLVIDDANLDADCKVALWSLITDSKIRSGLKKAAMEAKEAA
jgi:ERF superfamily